MDENPFNAGGPADEEVDLYGEFWLPRICRPNVAGFFSLRRGRAGDAES